MLLLLMPATGAGAIAAAVMLAMGIAWIIHKKVYQRAFWKSRQYFLGLVVIFVAAYLGLVFYDRWLPSRELQVIAASLGMPLETTLLTAAGILGTLSIPFLYTGIQTITQKHFGANQENSFTGSLLSCLLVSVVTVMLAQVMIDVPVLSMGESNFSWGILIVAAVILIFYCLFGKIVPSIFVGAGIFMVISTINVYVYRFRERLLEPTDVFSASTAMNVIENYSLFPISSNVLFGWNIFVAIVLVLYCLQHKQKSELTLRRRCALLCACAVSTIGIGTCISELETYHWAKEGAEINGYVLDFVSKFKELYVPKPDNYSTDLIAQLADQYAAGSHADVSDASKPPHILVIMDEGFADLRVVGDFTTNQEVTPFISSLKEDALSGYALVSVFGGNTANSEYEFLTGNSMAWLSPNTVPYQQYIQSPTYSMVSYLKDSYDYRCIALHPYEASGWNRPAVYGHLGFDEMHFLEDFPQEKYVRKYVSDQEMFEVMIEAFEAKKENPLFLVGVTMQNHGGFGYVSEGPTYTKHISLPDYPDKYREAEEYLSVIHETDKAVAYLINYFQNVDEEVVIVFFGDHQPSIEESFYRKISGSGEHTLETEQNRYKVPFFIWANYDIEETYMDCVSLNYLSSHVYETAGIPLPPYNQFLRELESRIPAMNVNSFFSQASGSYVLFDDGSKEEKQWLELYEALQYNNIFDKKHRNETLFPVLSGKVQS